MDGLTDEVIKEVGFPLVSNLAAVVVEVRKFEFDVAEKVVEDWSDLLFVKSDVCVRVSLSRHVKVQPARPIRSFCALDIPSFTVKRVLLVGKALVPLPRRCLDVDRRHGVIVTLLLHEVRLLSNQDLPQAVINKSYTAVVFDMVKDQHAIG